MNLRFVAGFPTYRQSVKNKYDIKRYISYYNKYDGYGVWATIEKISEKFIGWYMFIPVNELPWFNPELNDPEEIEIGFCLHKDVWGKGYATEMTKSLISKGFAELGTQRVIGTALAANTASIRVMEKAGMKLEKKFFYEELESIKAPAQEIVIYGLNKESYLQEKDCIDYK